MLPFRTASWKRTGQVRITRYMCLFTLPLLTVERPPEGLPLGLSPGQGRKCLIHQGKQELFEGAVQAVNDAAKRAEEAGKEASAAAGEAKEVCFLAGKVSDRHTGSGRTGR